jgi:hypothetical protein
VLNWLQVDTAAEVTVAVADRSVAFTCHEDGGPVEFLEGAVSHLEAQAGPLRVQLTVARLRCPYFETGGISPDQRWLGVCVASIELEPLPPEEADELLSSPIADLFPAGAPS